MKYCLNTESMRKYMYHYMHVWCKVLWNYMHWLNSYAKKCSKCNAFFPDIFTWLWISKWHLFWRSPISTPILFISRNAMRKHRWRHWMLFLFVNNIVLHCQEKNKWKVRDKGKKQWKNRFLQQPMKGVETGVCQNK